MRMRFKWIVACLLTLMPFFTAQAENREPIVLPLSLIIQTEGKLFERKTSRNTTQPTAAVIADAYHMRLGISINQGRRDPSWPNLRFCSGEIKQGPFEYATTTNFKGKFNQLDTPVLEKASEALTLKLKGLNFDETDLVVDTTLIPEEVAELSSAIDVAKGITVVKTLAVTNLLKPGRMSRTVVGLWDVYPLYDSKPIVVIKYRDGKVISVERLKTLSPEELTGALGLMVAFNSFTNGYMDEESKRDDPEIYEAKPLAFNLFSPTSRLKVKHSVEREQDGIYYEVTLNAFGSTKDRKPYTRVGYATKDDHASWFESTNGSAKGADSALGNEAMIATKEKLIAAVAKIRSVEDGGKLILDEEPIEIPDDFFRLPDGLSLEVPGTEDLVRYLAIPVWNEEQKNLTHKIIIQVQDEGKQYAVYRMQGLSREDTNLAIKVLVAFNSVARAVSERNAVYISPAPIPLPPGRNRDGSPNYPKGFRK